MPGMIMAKYCKMGKNVYVDYQKTAYQKPHVFKLFKDEIPFRQQKQLQFRVEPGFRRENEKSRTNNCYQSVSEQIDG